MRIVPLLMAMASLLVTACAPLPPPVPTGPSPAPAGTHRPQPVLEVCFASASNAPVTDTFDRIIDYHPIILVNGRVPLMLAPAPNVCLSSGYGFRNGRGHKGIDLTSRPPSQIYAAGHGRVREARVARGFGNYVLIEHGSGVFTRYAHLESFAPGIRPGKAIAFGEPIGVMGRSGNATGIHLHYEILTGSLRNPQGSFGLTANDPFGFPPWEPPAS